MNENCYLELFRTDRAELERLMAEAMAAGAGYADIYFECTNFTNLLLKDSQVTSGGYHEDFGAGIRVLCGERTGYSYCETTEPADMRAAMKAATAICAAGGGCAPGSRGISTGAGRAGYPIMSNRSRA